jgi:hypothetical protein
VSAHLQTYGLSHFSFIIRQGVSAMFNEWSKGGCKRERFPCTKALEVVITADYTKYIQPFCSFLWYICLLFGELSSVRNVAFGTDMGFIAVKEIDFSLVQNGCVELRCFRLRIVSPNHFGLCSDLCRAQPSDLSNTQRQRIWKEKFSPLRKPRARTFRSDAVNIRILIRICILYRAKIQQFYYM